MIPISILRKLDGWVITRLFRSQRWLAERKLADALNCALCQMGLQEPVVGDTSTMRNTILGNECNLNLLIVLMGLWEPHEVPSILAEQGLIDESSHATR